MSAYVSSLTHPSELWAVVKAFFVFGYRGASIAQHMHPNETKCYDYLNKTSRSFSRVIQALDEELRFPVCLFYLVLRGLDTIEDDMTIPLTEKKEILQRFHTRLTQPGWKFMGNGPNEKDAPLLKEFDVVIEEFMKLRPGYQNTIRDICRKMAEGMIHYREHPTIMSMKDYDDYTYYVAQLVGIGLSELFVESGLEVQLRELKHDQLEDLSCKMGMFLQKVNIIKDFNEDLEEGRWFWPRCVWEKYVTALEKDAGKDEDEDTRRLKSLLEERNRDRALACLNELCVDALQAVPDCIEYLSLLQNESIFKFCAIPQVMALATFTLFFNNPQIFTTKGLKIRRGTTIKLMLESTNTENLKRIYMGYIEQLRRSNKARAKSKNGDNKFDTSFAGMESVCDKIEQALERVCPSPKDKGHPFLSSTNLLIVVVVVIMSMYWYYVVNNN